MDSGIEENWQGLPAPEKVAKEKLKNRMRKQAAIFGDLGVYVGSEFFVDSMYGFDEFTWHQRIVSYSPTFLLSYSPTLASIKSQIKDRYQHLLATGKVYEMSPEDVRRNDRFAIWYVELPETVFDPAGPEAGYTWQQGSSYRQLRHIIQWVTRALHAEHMSKEANSEAPLLSVQYEWAESSCTSLQGL